MPPLSFVLLSLVAALASACFFYQRKINAQLRARLQRVAEDKSWLDRQAGNVARLFAYMGLRTMVKYLPTSLIKNEKASAAAFDVACHLGNDHLYAGRYRQIGTRALLMTDGLAAHYLQGIAADEAFPSYIRDMARRGTLEDAINVVIALSYLAMTDDPSVIDCWHFGVPEDEMAAFLAGYP